MYYTLYVDKQIVIKKNDDHKSDVSGSIIVYAGYINLIVTLLMNTLPISCIIMLNALFLFLQIEFGNVILLI